MRQRKSPRRQEYDYTSAGMYFVTVCTQDRQYLFGEIQHGKMILSEIGRICDQEIYKTEILRPYIDMHASVVMPNHIHLLMYVDRSSDDGEIYGIGYDAEMNCIEMHGVGTNNIETHGVGTHGVGTHGNASTTITTTDPMNKDRLPSVPTKTNNPMNKDVLPHVPTNPAISTAIHNPIVTLGSIICNIKSSVSKYANKYDIPFGRQGRYHDHIVRTEADYNRIKYYIEENVRNREDDGMYER